MLEEVAVVATSRFVTLAGLVSQSGLDHDLRALRLLARVGAVL